MLTLIILQKVVKSLNNIKFIQNRLHPDMFSEYIEAALRRAKY